MELQPVVDNLWNQAISHNTRQTYETGYQTYIRFLLFKKCEYSDEFLKNKQTFLKTSNVMGYLI
jgi:hypothetical protein